MSKGKAAKGTRHAVRVAKQAERDLADVFRAWKFDLAGRTRPSRPALTRAPTKNGDDRDPGRGERKSKYRTPYITV